MTNCCDSWGRCTRGQDCPIRDLPQNASVRGWSTGCCHSADCQDTHCPGRPTARRAAPLARRCDLLGVCQGHMPACEGCTPPITVNSDANSPQAATPPGGRLELDRPPAPRRALGPAGGRQRRVGAVPAPRLHGRLAVRPLTLDPTPTPPTEDELREAYEVCRSRRSPATFEQAMADPQMAALVKACARGRRARRRAPQTPSPADARPAPPTPRPATAPGYVDHKRAAAGDRDD